MSAVGGKADVLAAPSERLSLAKVCYGNVWRGHANSQTTLREKPVKIGSMNAMSHSN